MQPGGPGGGVSPASRSTTIVPAADLAGRPDLIEKEASRLMHQFRKLVGDITYIHTREGLVYPAGRDGAACSKRIVGYAIAGTHANRPASKTLCKIGGSELPAHQGCDNFSCRVRGSQYASADYTAFMNKYGFLASVGRAGVCHVQRRSRYHSTPPAQERTRQPGGYTTPEEKQSKR